MAEVIVYSENTLLGVGLNSLIQSCVTTKGMVSKYTQSYLTTLRLAKKAKFIFYDENGELYKTRRQIFLIKKFNPEIKVFSLTSGTEYSIKRVMNIYTCKKNSFKYSSLPHVIRTLQYIKYTTPALDRDVDFSDKSQIYKGMLPKLTERESLVLNLILKGKCNAEISSLLDMTPKTISAHRRSLFRKMNVRNIAEFFAVMH